MESTAVRKMKINPPAIQGSADGCIPLSMIRTGESAVVVKIHGKDEIKRFLESLGFVEGSEVAIVSELLGNVIVNVKGTRVAISHAMASRVRVCAV